ncbi:hypothetical protein FQZ97_803240 [compost metagenome]
MVVQNRNAFERRRDRHRHTQQLGKFNRDALAVGIGHGPVKGAHRSEGANIPKWATGSIGKFVLKIGQPRYTGRDLVDALYEWSTILFVGQQFFCHRLVEVGPREALLFRRNRTVTLSPKRLIAKAIHILRETVKRECDQRIAHPVTRLNTPDCSPMSVEIPLAYRPGLSPVHFHSFAVIQIFGNRANRLDAHH